MLSDRQAIILQLLNSSIQVGLVDAFQMARRIDKDPESVAKDIRELGKVADIFLETTATPFNSISISHHLDKNTSAMLEIANTLKDLNEKIAPEQNHLPTTSSDLIKILNEMQSELTNTQE